MFILKNNKPEIDPKALFVPEFNDVWLRDHTKLKARANKELAYVYFVADFNSEYNIYGVEKLSIVARDIMENPAYKPDKMVKAAIAAYEKIQETYSMRYLRSVRSTADSLMKYFDDLQYKAGKDKALEYNPTKTFTAMKNFEEIIEKLEKWEKKIKGEEEGMQIRGGGKVGAFEDSETATWMKN